MKRQSITSRQISADILHKHDQFYGRGGRDATIINQLASNSLLKQVHPKITWIPSSTYLCWQCKANYTRGSYWFRVMVRLLYHRYAINRDVVPDQETHVLVAVWECFPSRFPSGSTHNMTWATSGRWLTQQVCLAACYQRNGVVIIY